MRLLRTLVLFALAVAGSTARADDSYRIVHTYSHDARAYTQGLIYIDGHLYESTGLEGRSSLRMDDLATGRVLQSATVPQQYFAEGLAASAAHWCSSPGNPTLPSSMTASAFACCTRFITTATAGD